MIVVDIGNTNIVIGIYVKSKLSHVYRFETKSKKFLNSIKKTINEKKYLPALILTGGLATTFKDQIEMKCYFEPHLTLLGLYLIGLKKNE